MVHALDIQDIARGVLARIQKGKFNIDAQSLTKYPGWSKLLKQDHVTEDSGNQIQFQIVLDQSNQAEHAGMYEPRTVSIPQLLTIGTCPWRHSRTFWGFERREVLMNRAPAKIVDHIKLRRNDAIMGLAEIIESAVWGLAAASDDDTPFGVQNSVTTTGYSATGGFNGTVPTGYTTVFGINPTTKTNWRNYNAQYTAVTAANLMHLIRLAMLRTQFTDLVDTDDHGKAVKSGRYGLYANESVIVAVEELLEGTNQNLIFDTAPAFGRSMFHRMAWDHVPQLDADATNKIYLLDWKYLHLAVLAGDNLYEHPPTKQNDDPNTLVAQIDLTWNFYCSSRRRQSVFSL